jgi:hypothetical protein
MQDDLRKDMGVPEDDPADDLVRAYHLNIQLWHFL